MNLIFKQKSILRLIAVLFAVSALMSPVWAQASQKAIAKFVSGEVKFQKRSQGEWKPLKVGAKVRHQDRIRTFAASQLEIEFENGTTLKVQENSIVSMKELLQKGQQKNTTINVKKGNVLFNIKKLTSKKSSFKFESVTATAAIRGTSGGFGYLKTGAVVYLKTGALDLKSKSGGLYKIKPNELAIQKAKGFVVRKFKDTKSLDLVLKKITELDKKLQTSADSASNADPNNTPDDSLVVDSIDIEGVGLDSLFEALGDSIEVETIATEDQSEGDLEEDTTTTTQDSVLTETSSVETSLDAYPSVVNVPEMSLSGSCPDGSIVMVGALSSEVANGRWNIKIRWAEHEEGTKTFQAYCLLKKDKYEIGTVSFQYERPVEEFALNLETSTSQKVTSGKVNIKGTYSGKDTRLILTAGTRSVELSNPAKAFNYDFLISDAARTWDLTQLTLKLKGSEGEISEVITLDVDRSAKAVNTYPPVVTMSMDQTKGVVRANVSKIEGDIAQVGYYVDGDLIEESEITNNIVGKQFNLEAGEHSYEVIAEDQAGNVGRQVLQNISYYPRAIFQINLNSPTRSGKIRVPPMPPGRQESLRELVEIRILNLPDDNHEYLKEVTVINQVANFRRVIRESQINSVYFDFDVPLKRGAKNKIIVRVTPQNGPVQEVFKEIEIVR